MRALDPLLAHNAGVWDTGRRTSLVVPEADAVAEAGRLVQRLPELWAAADLSERRRLLLTVLDAVHVNDRQARAMVSIGPKAAFAAVLGETSHGPPAVAALAAG